MKGVGILGSHIHLSHRWGLGGRFAFRLFGAGGTVGGDSLFTRWIGCNAGYNECIDLAKNDLSKLARHIGK